MTKKCYVIISLILFLILTFDCVYANEPLKKENPEGRKKMALKMLKHMSDEKGGELQDAINSHVYNMDTTYRISEEIPDAELNSIVLTLYISEQFYFYRTCLRLFINSHLASYNDRLNKELLYHLLIFRCPTGEIQNFFDIICSKYEHVENLKVRKELDKAKVTIPSIISELDNYLEILKGAFKEVKEGNAGKKLR